MHTTTIVIMIKRGCSLTASCVCRALVQQSFPFHASDDRKKAAEKVLNLLEAAAVVFENSTQH